MALGGVFVYSMSGRRRGKVPGGHFQGVVVQTLRGRISGVYSGTSIYLHWVWPSGTFAVRTLQRKDLAVVPTLEQGVAVTCLWMCDIGTDHKWIEL